MAPLATEWENYASHDVIGYKVENHEEDTLDDDDVVPGFRIPLNQFL